MVLRQIVASGCEALRIDCGVCPKVRRKLRRIRSRSPKPVSREISSTGRRLCSSNCLAASQDAHPGLGSRSMMAVVVMGVRSRITQTTSNGCSRSTIMSASARWSLKHSDRRPAVEHGPICKRKGGVWVVVEDGDFEAFLLGRRPGFRVKLLVRHETCTRALPKFRPASMPTKASGEFSGPSAMSSR